MEGKNSDEAGHGVCDKNTKRGKNNSCTKSVAARNNALANRNSFPNTALEKVTTHHLQH